MGNGDGLEVRPEQATISTYRGFDPGSKLVRVFICWPMRDSRATGDEHHALRAVAVPPVQVTTADAVITPSSEGASLAWLGLQQALDKLAIGGAVGLCTAAPAACAASAGSKPAVIFAPSRKENESYANVESM